MKISTYKHIIIIVVFFCLVSAGFAWGQGIKDRMLQRQPVIVDLKTKGIIGETNRGYLGFVTGQQVSQDVIAGENQDRKTIYVQIAKKQNSSIELVEKRRAQQLVERAKPGEFIQNDAGQWIKK